jgi:hypothetical protein
MFAIESEYRIAKIGDSQFKEFSADFQRWICEPPRELKIRRMMDFVEIHFRQRRRRMSGDTSTLSRLLD